MSIYMIFSLDRQDDNDDDDIDNINTIINIIPHTHKTGYFSDDVLTMNILVWGMPSTVFL